MAANIFTNLRNVAVPVTDQERSKALLEGLGFNVSMDTELRPGFRWIELSLPGGDASISLVQTGPELPTGIDTGIRLSPMTRASRARRSVPPASKPASSSTGPVYR